MSEKKIVKDDRYHLEWRDENGKLKMKPHSVTVWTPAGKPGVLFISPEVFEAEYIPKGFRYRDPKDLSVSVMP